MPKTIIITGGDSRYFPLMQGCVLSVREKPEGAAIPIGILDCGLKPEERRWCEEHKAKVVEPGWDVTFAKALTVATSFRAMTARPWLRRYFPGFETYVWLDADVWVQDWAAIALLMEGAKLGDIALVPEVHRSYGNLRDTREDFEQANGRAYAEGFGEEAARRLIRYPLNNAGVFAITAGSPAWDIWAELLADGATRSANMIDQIALNVAIYDRDLKEVRLPATCNWIAHLALPAWCEKRQLLVDPDPPFAPIGILHRTLGTKWQEALDLAVAGEPGQSVRKSIRYGDQGNGR
jgi:hypothetical protein